MKEPTEEELCLLVLASEAEVGPAGTARLRRAARRGAGSLSRLLRLSVDQLVDQVGLEPAAARAVAGLGDPIAAGRAVLDRAGELEARVLFPGRPDYPGRLVSALGQRTPAALFVQGAPALLAGACAAIVGSRRPSRTARAAARRLARSLSGDGFTVVSGGARGIDTEAHRAALAGGATAFVPPVGLARFEWRGGRPLPGGRWCVLGQFPLDCGWRTPHALLRNRTIVALSDAVVAFEPRDRGGTWNSANHALSLGRPLYVVSASTRGGKGRGARRLVRRGAVALDPARMPDPVAFRRMVDDYRPPVGETQIGLFNEEGPRGGGA